MSACLVKKSRKRFTNLIRSYKAPFRKELFHWTGLSGFAILQDMAKKITIETLAVMIQNGFQETASKREVDEKFKAIVDQLDFISADIRDIKITFGPLARAVAGLEIDMQDLQMRMKRVEKKIALPK